MPDELKSSELKPDEQNPPEQKVPEEPLFDVLVPPGVPRSIIAEVVKNFDVKLIERAERLTFANMEGDKRELLAFRGRREIVEQVEKFLIQRLNDFIRE